MARRASSRGRRGRFIVLEGIDGAGTTTQTAALSRELTSRGIPHLTTAQPSSGPIGSLLRQALAHRLVGTRNDASVPLDPRTMALLFAADRADHLEQIIQPALARGVTVICDRYLLSSLAYQGLYLAADYVEAINQGSPSPDVTLFLSVPPRLAQHRRSTRASEEMYEALALQRRIDRLYRKAIVRRHRQERIELIDGTQVPVAVTHDLLAHLGLIAEKPAGRAS